MGAGADERLSGLVRLFTRFYPRFGLPTHLIASKKGGDCWLCRIIALRLTCWFFSVLLSVEVKHMARRTTGEGSIYQRKDGTGWVAQVSADGQRKTFTGKTRKEAKAKLDEYRKATEIR